MGGVHKHLQAYPDHPGDARQVGSAPAARSTPTVAASDKRRLLLLTGVGSCSTATIVAGTQARGIVRERGQAWIWTAAAAELAGRVEVWFDGPVLRRRLRREPGTQDPGGPVGAGQQIADRSTCADGRTGAYGPAGNRRTAPTRAAQAAAAKRVGQRPAAPPRPRSPPLRPSRRPPHRPTRHEHQHQHLRSRPYQHQR